MCAKNQRAPIINKSRQELPGISSEKSYDQEAMETDSEICLMDVEGDL